MSDTPTEQFRRTDEEAARRGHPSYVWRAGQERRLALVRQWVTLEGARILDDGCGVGMYTARFCQFSPHVAGVEIDPAVADEARARTNAEIAVGRGEDLPFDDHSFDVVFSHEVIEHVDDDRQAAREMVRVLAPRGRIVHLLPEPLLPVRDARPLLARQVSFRQYAAHQLPAQPASQSPGATRQGLHFVWPAQPVCRAAGARHPPPGYLSRV